MYSRWLSSAVVLLWLSTMGWLVKEKVLPQVLLGDPPSHRSIIEARRGEPAASWRLLWNHSEVGWARSEIFPLADGGARIENRVHFDDLPVDRFAPSWLRGIFQAVDDSGKSAADAAGRVRGGKISTDAVSSLVIDGDNLLSSIETTITFLPSGEKITMRGTVAGDKLNVTVRSLDISFKTQIPIDDDSLFCDALAPADRLPDLYEGQKWTTSALTPLRYPNQPHGVLMAEVEGFEEITWNGRPVGAWLVVYRDSPGSTLGATAKPRGKLWVRRDGVVLKQEMSILNSSMTFVRRPADD